mgnify:CR=1 FL=1
MFTTLYTSKDVVSTSLTGLALMSLAAAVLCFVGLSWSNVRWRGWAETGGAGSPI